MYEYGINLRRVIDGDTIVADIDLGFGVWLKDKHIRVAGVDCPEVKTAEGLAAREFTTQWMTQEAPDKYLVNVKTHKADKYGRILGSIGRTIHKTQCTYLLDALLLNQHGKPYDGGKKDVI